MVVGRYVFDICVDCNYCKWSVCGFQSPDNRWYHSTYYLHCIFFCIRKDAAHGLRFSKSSVLAHLNQRALDNSDIIDLAQDCNFITFHHLLLSHEQLAAVQTDAPLPALVMNYVIELLNYSPMNLYNVQMKSAGFDAPIDNPQMFIQFFYDVLGSSWIVLTGNSVLYPPKSSELLPIRYYDSSHSFL